MSEATSAKTEGNIDDVRHVVIVMMENRSFDHYFGAMAGVRGFGVGGFRSTSLQRPDRERHAQERALAPSRRPAVPSEFPQPAVSAT